MTSLSSRTRTCNSQLVNLSRRAVTLRQGRQLNFLDLPVHQLLIFGFATRGPDPLRYLRGSYGNNQGKAKW